MITRLFTSFDPMTRFITLNYTIFFFVLFTPIILKFYINDQRILKLNQLTHTFLIKELNTSINNKNKKGKIIFLLRIFYLIIIINILGLIPYVFPIRSHLIFSLRLALPIWLSFVLFSIIYNLPYFISHIVPLGTPIILSQFIVIIETIRQIIRPITLSVRLAANLTAGHILIGLCINNIIIFHLYSIPLIILILLELAVAFIQRYVFTILITIYLRETYDTTKSSLPFSIL